MNITYNTMAMEWNFSPSGLEVALSSPHSVKDLVHLHNHLLSIIHEFVNVTKENFLQVRLSFLLKVQSTSQ